MPQMDLQRGPLIENEDEAPPPPPPPRSLQDSLELCPSVLRADLTHQAVTGASCSRWA